MIIETDILSGNAHVLLWICEKCDSKTMVNIFGTLKRYRCLKRCESCGEQTNTAHERVVRFTINDEKSSESNERVKRVIEAILSLTDEEKGEVFINFCSYCHKYDPDGRCQCSNDE